MPSDALSTYSSELILRCNQAQLKLKIHGIFVKSYYLRYQIAKELSLPPLTTI